MAPVHFEALDPIETVLYAWKLSSDMPKKALRQLDLRKFLLCNFINKKVMQIYDVR